MFLSRSRVLLILIVVVSSSLALPIQTEGLGKHYRRNVFDIFYGKVKKFNDEAYKTTKRKNPFEEYDDDDDLKHYLNENLDYGLLESLTNEMLGENGGDLDRELTSEDYEEISERYFKRLEEESSTEQPKGWKTSPNTDHRSNKFSTTSTTQTRANTRTGDDNKTPTDYDKTTPQQDINTTPQQGISTTPQQGINTKPGTLSDEWWTSPTYWWTSPSFWDGTIFGGNTAWQTWKQTTVRGADSWQTHEHTKHFDWTGESKNGHKVHVVVYFEK